MLGGHHVFSLNEAARVLPRPNGRECNIVWNCPKERYSCTDEHWHARDDQSLNESFLKKPLNGHAPVHVNVLDAASGELRHDSGGSPRHALHDCPVWRGSKRPGAEHEHRLPVVGPGIEGQYCLERVPTDDQGVDRCDELRVPVWLSATRRQKVEFAGGAGDEAVETRANKDGGSQFPVSCCRLTLTLRPRRFQDATGGCRPQAVVRQRSSRVAILTSRRMR